jgi:hypothetical protein
MWDAEDGTGLKQYFDRNRWLDRLLWLNEQIKHIPVTQAPTAEPIPALFTACDAAPYDMCKNQVGPSQLSARCRWGSGAA